MKFSYGTHNYFLQTWNHSNTFSSGSQKFEIIGTTPRKSEGTVLNNCFICCNQFQISKLFRLSAKPLQVMESQLSAQLWQPTLTFAEVLRVQGEAVAGQSLQQQFVAGPPAGLGDAGGRALHGRDALEKRRLAVETDALVQLREDTVTLDLLLLGQLRFERGKEERIGFYQRAEF